MSSNVFIPNKDFPAEIEREPKYTSGLAGEAEKAAALARSFAPVGEVEHVLKSGYVSKPGDYRRGIKTVVRGGKVYVAGTDYKSHWIEYGSAHNTPSSPLRRGVRAAGLRFVGSSK